MVGNTSMTDGKKRDQESLALRRRMVEDQIKPRGIRDARVLEAMMTVPRELFVPPGLRAEAYDDRALPVAHGQTISQPFIVAYMTEQLALTPEDRVLEIGTGTGYQTAILAHLCRQVYTVERIAALQAEAENVLRDMNLKNVTMSTGDGSLGLPEHAPYDSIMVTAAAPHTPVPLVEQLAEGGRLVVPVGGAFEQTIVRVVRRGDRSTETPMLACRFVKLIGKEGWSGG
jgi:protein-L-isoaspartate(D-aspartate) O-methyltransferase